ncbi:tyrosine-protein phosphatase [Sphingomicrobium sp. XHP0239]|uniref:tyrosine-protein phosphatase n=1 Tax=Sphingomicrobium maritimum TaxID=3133972 RepID=UPI0031CC38CF
MTETAKPEDADRFLLLEGARNCRDFGGYRTRGGETVARGKLFRSNRLSQLTAADCERLDATGIDTIFDLRVSREREADPTVWDAPHLTVHTYPPGHKRRLVDMALDYPPTEAGALDLMQDFYAQLPLTLAHAFADILRRIADGALPCLIHCSAGKDRTGMAAALILEALDVPRATILADYALTDLDRVDEEGMARSVVSAKNVSGSSARERLRQRFGDEAIAVMRSARQSFLEAAFAGAERAHGSMTGWFDANGVDAPTRDRLAARLLERR